LGKKHQTKEDPAAATLAVQTNRNIILLAVFVGGNAVNIAISYANNYKDIKDRNSQILEQLFFVFYPYRFSTARTKLNS
jgi:hypothetical protein